MTAPLPSAIAACEFLEWDSRFFGHRIARVSARSLTPAGVDAVRDWCAAEKVECVYFLADAADGQSVRVAEENGFSFVDVRVTLERHHGPPNPPGPAFEGTLRVSQPADVPALKAMASTGFRSSRFYYDPHFPRPKVDLLYATWIEKSCNGYADVVLVADVRGEPVGYVSCHLHGDRIGQVGLLGVRDDCQGQGLGRVLLTAGLAWFGDRGSESVRVVTQGRNRGALRVYQQGGFLIQAVELWYHWWLGREARRAI
jgi:dTDP-4-amino-4,6-dideoxy-D-galactose acyltransferase